MWKTVGWVSLGMALAALGIAALVRFTDSGKAAIAKLEG